MFMETLQIEIVNPKARRLLKELADLNLIAIKTNDPSKDFQALLKKLRSGRGKPTSDEISREVGIVRRKRHGKKN